MFNNINSVANNISKIVGEYVIVTRILNLKNCANYRKYGHEYDRANC